MPIQNCGMWGIDSQATELEGALKRKMLNLDRGNVLISVWAQQSRDKQNYVN